MAKEIKRKGKKKNFYRPWMKGYVSKILILAMVGVFLISGVLLFAVQESNERVAVVKNQVLQMAQQSNYKSERLEVYWDGQKIKELRREYDANLNLLVTDLDTNAVWQTVDGKVLFMGQIVSDELPYLDGSYTLLSLLDSKVDTSQEKGWELFQKLTGLGNDAELEVYDVEFGENEVPAYRIIGKITKQESEFLSNDVEKRLGVSFSEDGQAVIDVIIGKRLGVVMEVKITTSSNELVLDYYNS